MTSNSTLEDMREARDIIEGLYNAAHSLVCDDPDCPWAQFFNAPSGPTNEGTSSRDEALLLVLLGIVEDIEECLDLVRILVANRDETGRPDHLTQSSTTSSSSTEDTAIDSQGSLEEPPVPGLYRDQWTQTPAFSPPAYTAFCNGHPRGTPPAPATSLATSETSTPNAGDPITEHEEGVSRGGQQEQDRAEILPESFPFQAEDP
ncbi:hypothetical protein F5883DRAFT_51526 [Diaporthe sp. PMI_573]|nr:hypothetical protein F5883DRAFT_51526 [Diaporthaceae sp. PMI_573]